jgi:hypothetical protein
MTAFRFAKPSVWRVIWSLIAVAAASCVLAGTGLFIHALVVSHNDPTPTSTGDYIRLFIAFILLWGPSLLMIVWWISVPMITGLGVLAACIRRGAATDTSSEHVPAGGKPVSDSW